MKHRVSAVAGALTVVLLSACGPAEQAPEPTLSDTEARAIIDDMMSGWDAVVKAGELGSNAAVYTDDAIRMQPNMPALVGREAIQAWMEEQRAAYSFEGSNEIVEVRALSPDWILFRTEGSWTRTPKAGGEPSVSDGKWLSIAQRQPDGSWKLYRDCGNSDLPG